MCMSNRLLNAVLAKNATVLTSLFESGVQLDVVEYQHKGASRMVDGSVWTEVVLSDWKEGAEILIRHLPHMNNIEMVLLAVRSGSSDVLRVLWAHLEHDPSWVYTYETETEILQSVMGGIGQIYNKAFETKDMTQTILTLVDLGVDLSGYLPGDFDFKDFRPQGHSIWTRTLSTRKMHYVDKFWPQWHTMQNWPRLNEVVFDLVSFSVGDEVSLHDPTFNQQAQKNLMRFLTDFGLDWIEQIANEPEPNLLRALVVDGGDVVQSNAPTLGATTHTILSINRGSDVKTPTVLEFLCSPLKYKSAAWLRLPLIVPREHRNVLWPIWEKMHGLDPYATWLNVLSTNPTETTTNVLKLLQSEMPEFWSKIWFEPDHEGLSADRKWKTLGGDVFYE